MSDVSKPAINIASREFFQVFLVTYLLLTLAETLKEGFVSNFFNMNYLLLVVLISGLAMVLTEPAEGAIGQAVEATKKQVTKTAKQVARPAAAGIRAMRRSNVIDLRKIEPTPADAAKPVSSKHPHQLG